MGSRSRVLLLMVLLLATALAPAVPANHSNSGASKRLLFYPAAAPCDAADPLMETAIAILYRDVNTGTEVTYWLRPDARFDSCSAFETTERMHWNATSTAPPFKVGDKFRFKVKFHAVVTSSGCGVTSGPSYAGRLTSRDLGLNGTLDIRGNSAVTVNFENKSAADGWFVVPKPGDRVKIDADSRLTTNNNTVAALERESPTDTELTRNKAQVVLDALYMCNENVVGAVPKWVPKKKVVNHLWLSLDNVRPEVYVRSSHDGAALVNGNPQPVQSLPWSASNKDLYDGENATVNSQISVDVQICDKDFDPATYKVKIDFRPLDPAHVGPLPGKPRDWATAFTRVDPAPLCGTRAGWRLLETVTLADSTRAAAALDKFYDPITGRFEYRGIEVNVSDEQAASWSDARGNLKAVSVALNVDTMRPALASGLVAAPQPAGGVLLSWSLPFGGSSHYLTQDLRRIEITYAPVDAPGSAQTIVLRNGTTLVNPPTHPTAPCAATTNSGTGARTHQWTDPSKLPTCLRLPGLLLPTAPPLGADGASRLYSFTVVTRDDAGNAPLAPLQAVAQLDARAPVATLLTVPGDDGPADDGFSRLATIALRATDDTPRPSGAAAVKRVTVSIFNTTTSQWWDGTTSLWTSGAERLIPLTEGAGGVWSVAPALKGTGGRMLLTFRVEDEAGNVATAQRTVVHDARTPRVVDSSTPTTAQQGLPLVATVEATDEGDRIRVVNVTLLGSGGAEAKKTTWCIGACPAGASGAVVSSLQGPWTFELATAGVPLGRYGVVIDASDGAWNRARVTRPDVVVGPRAQLALTPTTPYLADGRLSARVTAGYDATSDANGQPCADGLCAPEVILERFTSSGTWAEVARLARPTSDSATGRLFTYAFDGIDASSLGASPRIRARAVGPAVDFATPATEPKTPASEGVTFTQPLTAWAPDKWYVTRAPAGVTLAMKLTTAGAAADGVRVRITPTSPAGAAVWANATYNAATATWTLPAGDLADGEYEVLACPQAAADLVRNDVARCIYPVARRLGVEKDAGSLSVRVNGRPEPFSWAARQVVLDIDATTGFDNVTSGSQVRVTATSTTGSFGVATVRPTVLTTDPAASVFAIRIVVDIASAAQAGATGTLNVEVKTDGGATLTKSLPLTYDGILPVANFAKLADGSPTEVRGWANDTLSGVDRVVVTFTRDDGAWWTGSAWSTATPAGAVREPSCANAQNRTCSWSLPLAGAVPLDETGRTYSVRVVARDLAGNAGGPPVDSRKLDNVAPAVGDVAAPTGTLVARGTAAFDVPVTDAVSGVTSVEATLRLPGGNVTTHPLTRTAGDARSGTWHLDLAGAQLPYAGDYTITFRAVDRGANAGVRADIAFTVADDAPIVIDSGVVAPNPVEAWAGATLTAVVTERAKVSYVRAELTKDGATVGTLTLAPAAVDVVSGAGRYAATTLGAITLERGATYAVTFRAKDLANAEVTSAATLTVSANDRPRVTLLAFDDGASRWIRAEGPLTWEILDDNPSTQAAWAEIVVDGVARNVTSTLQVTPTAQGLRAVAVVTPALPAAASVTARLKVADLLGVVTESAVAVRVDAAGPAIVSEVAGGLARDGVTYLTPLAEVHVEAVDGASGLASFEASFNGVAWSPITSPLDVGAYDSLPHGNRTVLLRAIDRAGNVALTNLTLVVDKEAPAIASLAVARVVRVGVSDAGVGLNASSVALHVQQPVTGAWLVVPMQAAGGAWEATVPAAVSGRFSWYATARDRVGNAGALGGPTAPLVGFTHNLAPSILLVGFANGTTVRGAVPLVWLVEDPEGGAYNVTATARRGDATAPVGGGTNITALSWDTTQLSDGEAILRIEATDGRATTVVERKLLVLNAGGARLAVQPPKLAVAGDTLGVRLAPDTNLTVRNVTARVERLVVGDTWLPVATGLALEQRDRQFVLDYTPPFAGRYRIVLEIEYDGVVGMDNLTWGPVNVASARPVDPTPTFSPLFAAVVLGIVILIAGAAVAAWRWRT